MSDNTMLQKVLDGQTVIREDIKKVEERLTKRLDTIGADVAQLHDDAPTVEEFDNLKKRVDKYHPETKAL